MEQVRSLTGDIDVTSVAKRWMRVIGDIDVTT